MEGHSQLFSDLLFELCKYDGGIPIDRILNANTETEAIDIILETITLKSNKVHCDTVNDLPSLSSVKETQWKYCPHCGHKL